MIEDLRPGTDPILKPILKFSRKVEFDQPLIFKRAGRGRG